MKLMKYISSMVVALLIISTTGCSVNTQMVISDVDVANNLDGILNYYSDSLILNYFKESKDNIIGFTDTEVISDIKKLDVHKKLKFDKQIIDDIQGTYEVYTIFEEDKVVELKLKVSKDESTKSIYVSSIELRLHNESIIIYYDGSKYSIKIDSLSPLAIDRPEHSLGGRYNALQQAIKINEDLSLSEIEVILNHKFTDEEIAVIDVDNTNASNKLEKKLRFKNEEGVVELVFIADKLKAMSYTEGVTYSYKSEGYESIGAHIVPGNCYSLMKNNFENLDEVQLFLNDNYSKIVINQVDKI